MLWVAVQALQRAYGPRVHTVIYTGDVDSAPAAILERALTRFQLSVDPTTVTFVYLRTRPWVEASRYPYATMLLQSLGSLLLGLEALAHAAPAILLDSMGYAFVLPLFRYFGGCQVAAIVLGWFGVVGFFFS